jgi:hypothetical protein
MSWKMARFYFSVAVVSLLVVMLLSGRAAAVLVIASDDASDSAYSTGSPVWATGDNGGMGFNSWSLSTGGSPAGFFIGDSTGLSNPGADINTSGKSFGMFAGDNNSSTNEFADAVRSFSSALAVGSTFSLDLAVNFRNGNKGFDLRNSGGSTIFNFNVGGDDYRVNAAATGNGSIGNTYSSNTEFLFSFTQTSTTGGTWSINRSGGVSDFDTGTYSGVAAGFKLYISGTGGGSPNDLFANSFQITAIPEASSIFAVGLFGLSSAAIAWLRKRHNAGAP